MFEHSGPLLGFYGDDFTGSTDAMEALAVNGVETLLFLRTPSQQEVQAIRGKVAAMGIAGISRSQDPAQMDASLPTPFNALKALQAPLVHYKVCSTFDSAPQVGNIGRAIEIGRACFPPSGTANATPLIVGAPQLRRYTAFGHLFAAAGESCWRIDRHPTMSVHPVTPMREADLLRHLSLQTALRSGLLDFPTLQRPDAASLFEQAMADSDMLLIDVLDAASQRSAGELLWQAAMRQPGHTLFCAGSSGVEYALIHAWRAAGLLPTAAPTWHAGPVDAIAAVSGSCSPVTARQIQQAHADGFACIRVATDCLLEDGAAIQETARVSQAMKDALAKGRSVLAYTAQGPDDPAIAVFNQQAAASRFTKGEALEQVGRQLGAILRNVVHDTGIKRIAVAGGDTSGQVVQALGLTALRMQTPLTPGAPLCAAYTQPDASPTLEVALKGGQLGSEQFFSNVRSGRVL